MISSLITLARSNTLSEKWNVDSSILTVPINLILLPISTVGLYLSELYNLDSYSDEYNLKTLDFSGISKIDKNWLK